MRAAEFTPESYFSENTNPRGSPKQGHRLQGQPRSAEVSRGKSQGGRLGEEWGRSQRAPQEERGQAGPAGWGQGAVARGCGLGPSPRGSRQPWTGWRAFSYHAGSPSGQGALKQV